MKNKRVFGKGWNVFYLKLTILDVRDMPNGFMTNWVTPWSLWPSNTKASKLVGGGLVSKFMWGIVDITNKNTRNWFLSLVYTLTIHNTMIIKDI